MTPKERLERIKTAINSGGVYRGYTDSIKPFMEDIKAVEEALEELEELKQEIKDRQETEESLGKELIKVGDELEQLKRDVKRFMELTPKVKFRPLQDEVYSLQQKLLKVGKEE